MILSSVLLVSVSNINGDASNLTTVIDVSSNYFRIGYCLDSALLSCYYVFISAWQAVATAAQDERCRIVSGKHSEDDAWAMTLSSCDEEEPTLQEL